MNLTATVGHERFQFADMCDVFAKAGEEKSGDRLAGIGARSEARAGRRQDRAG